MIDRMPKAPYSCKPEAKWYGTIPRNESELRELIEQVRYDGHDELAVEQILADYEHRKRQYAELKEREETEMTQNTQNINPLDVKRTRIPEGYYEALTLSANLEERQDGRYTLVLEIQLTNPADGTTETVSQRYYQRYFQFMFDNLKRYYGSEAENADTLGKVLKITNRLKWAAEVKYNGDFMNVNPLKIAPSANLTPSVKVTELF